METGMADWLSIFQHNNIMSFAYVLGRAARNQSRISMLDWGGGMGHYCRIAETLYPDLEIEYHNKDLPVAVKAGPAAYRLAAVATSSVRWETPGARGRS